MTDKSPEELSTGFILSELERSQTNFDVAAYQFNSVLAYLERELSRAGKKAREWRVTVCVKVEP